MCKNIVVRVLKIAFWSLLFCLQSCRFSPVNVENRLDEAEELYRQGAYSNNSSQYESSTEYLKHAEGILLSIQPSDIGNPQLERRNRLLGLVWFRLGNTSESEMLYDIAHSYYRKAIPLLNPDSNSLYLTCAYRDMARTMALTGGEQDSVLWYFSQAEQHAKEAKSDLLLLDIDAYRYQICYPDSVSHRLIVCKQLAEEYQVPARYSEIVELLLAQHATDSAAYYLERLRPTDSAYTYWFEQSYAYLQSKILLQRGQADEAYRVLLNLYDRKIDGSRATDGRK